MVEEIRNLLADGEASRSYFVAETMGRSAGWLAYGAAIAGEMAAELYDLVILERRLAPGFDLAMRLIDGLPLEAGRAD